MRVILAACLLCGGCDDTESVPAVPVRDAAVDATPPPVDMLLEADAAPAGPRLIHVGQSADPRPADGSRERPYPTARAGFAVAEPGDVVFLLGGDHAPIEGWPADVELLGAGPESTRVAGPLRVEQPGAVVGGFTLVDGALDVQQTATISDVVIEAAPTPALVVAAPTTLREVRVAAPTGAEAAATVSAALTWEGGGIASSPGTALLSEAADLTLIDLDLDDCGGFGIFAEGGRHLVRGLRVRGAAGAAARFLRAETEVIDCGVADVATSENVGEGVGFIDGTGTVDGCEVVDAERGLRVTLGGRMTARNLRISRMRGDGVTINDESTAEVEGLRISGARNGGVTVVRANATLREVEVADARRHGVLISESEATLAAIDIRGGEARGLALLRSTATVEGGRITDAGEVCVQVTDPAGANALSGLTLENCAGAGLGVFGDGEGSVQLSDTTITGVTPGPDDFVAGVHVFDGRATLDTVTIRAGQGEGVRFENGTGRLDAVTIEDHPAPGLAVLAPSAPVVADGLVVRRAGGAGVLLTEGALELVEPEITETRAAAGIGPGDGIAAPFQAVLTVRRGVLADNANNGAWVDGFSIVRLLDTVTLRDNGGFGVLVGCGSTLEVPFSYDAPGNTRGAESICR